MSRRFTKAVVVLVGAFAAAQLVRPARINPPTDPRRTIQAQAGTSKELAAVLERACGDCHSNETVWQRYTQIAPVSWVIVHGVAAGRRTVNFSEWAGYPPEQQRALLAASCSAASAGRMPGEYTLLRPETKLSAGDIEAICAATRPPAANAGNGH